MRLTKRIRWRVGFARVVLLQLRSANPPEVVATYRRLRANQLSIWHAFGLLIAVYEAEVASMLSEGRVYDHERYLRQRLPRARRQRRQSAQIPLVIVYSALAQHAFHLRLVHRD